VGVESVKVETEHHKLINKFGNEFACLIDASYDELASIAGDRLADAIIRTREGKISVLAGYDGVYGEISIVEGEKEKKQLSLF